MTSRSTVTLVLRSGRDVAFTTSTAEATQIRGAVLSRWSLGTDPNDVPYLEFGAGDQPTDAVLYGEIAAVHLDPVEGDDRAADDRA